MAVVQKNGRIEVVVDAPVESVWRVVADVTRTGEWSHECCEVRWLNGAEVAAPGARFRGRNRAGPWRWGRTCEILTVDACRSIAWRTVSTPLFPDSTIWRFTLEPAGDRTRIVQEFEVVRAPKVLDHIYASIIPSHQDRNARLCMDLERIGMLAKGVSALSFPDAMRPPKKRSKRRMTRAGNCAAVWMYRRFDGRLASGRRGVRVLLLTVPGRRTGEPRSTCVRYLPIECGWIVWGTGSGYARDPDWFENLRCADAATVQIGGVVHNIVPHEIVGQERDRVWSHVVLAQAPEVARYARRAGRTIPVAELVRSTT